MKSRIIHILLPLLLLLCATLPAAAENIILSHEGTVRFFDVTEMDDVLQAAVPNDTVFLPDCPLPGLTVTKDITLMGAGENTIILGNIRINPEDRTPWQNVLLDGITVHGNIFNEAECDGLHIRRTKCKDLSVGSSYDANNVVIESCHITENFNAYFYAENCQIINCVVDGSACPGNKFKNVRFMNCTIKQQYNGGYPFCAINTIFVNPGSGVLHFPTESYLENCLILHSGDTLFSDGYVKDSSAVDIDSFGEMTEENVRQKGFLGTDGTIIGHWGGRIGFTLEPTLPYVKEKQITLDENSGDLKVKVTLGSIEESSVL